jgi:hypothetical protein
VAVIGPRIRARSLLGREINAFAALSDQISDLSGAVITADAMH